MNTVCHISTVHKLIDNRILYKECSSLAANGFNTYLIINAEQTQTINNVKIIPLKERGRLHRITVKQISALLKALETEASVFHLHDPELIPMGIFLKALNKKVIFDFHELVYFQIEDKDYLNPTTKKIAKSLYKAFERVAVSQFDGLILAEDGYREYFETNYRNRFDKIRFIRNYPRISVLEKIKPHPYPKNKPVVAYLGDLTYIRGILHMLKAVELLKGKVEFMLIGKWGSREIEEKAKREKGWQYTNYLGFLPPETAYSYLKNADIALALVHPVKNHMTSRLVKIFEYMGLGIPALLSDFQYWRESFKDYCFYTDPLNPEKIAASISNMLENKKETEEKAQKAKQFVLSNFSWENEEKKLLNFYEKILSD